MSQTTKTKTDKIEVHAASNPNFLSFQIMKTHFWILSSFALLAWNVSGQPAALTDKTNSCQIAAAGSHERVWRRVTADVAGHTNVNSYTVLATGLDLWNTAHGPSEESRISIAMEAPRLQIVASIRLFLQRTSILAARSTSGAG